MTCRVGFTCGAFDLLHAGHIVMLREAKSNCDYLIVGLQTDPTIQEKGYTKFFTQVGNILFQQHN